MPKTLDELVADAKQIKAKGIVEYPIGLPLSPTEGASTSWYLLTKAFGGDLFDKDFKPLFTTPDSAGYKAMAFELQLLKEGLVDPASTGLRDSQINDSMFAKGLTSIMISGEPGRLGQMNDPAQSQVAGQVEAILVPTASGTTRSYGLLEALGVPKVSQNQEAAVAFIKWFTSKQFQIENYWNGVLPTRTSALADAQRCGQASSAATSLVEQSKIVEPLFAQGTPTWYPQFSSAVNTAINSVAKGADHASTRRCRTSPTPRKKAMANDGSRRPSASKSKRRAAGNGDAMLGILLVAPIFVTMVALVFYPAGADRLGQPASDQPDAGRARRSSASTNYTRMLSDAQLGTAWINTFIYVALAVTAETVVRRARRGAASTRSTFGPQVAARRGRPAVGAARRRQRRHLAVDLSARRGPAERNPHRVRPAVREPCLVQRPHQRHRRRLGRACLADDAADRRHRARGHAEHSRSSLRGGAHRRRDALADVLVDHAAADPQRHRRLDDQRHGYGLQSLRRGLGPGRLEPRYASGADPDLSRDLPEPALLLRHGAVAVLVTLVSLLVSLVFVLRVYRNTRFD